MRFCALKHGRLDFHCVPKWFFLVKTRVADQKNTKILKHFWSQNTCFFAFVLLQVAQVCACQGPCGQKCEPFSQKTSWGAKNANPSAYFHSGRPQTSNPSAYVRLWWLQTSNPNAYFVPWALQLSISSIGFVPWAIWGSKLQRNSFSLFGSPPKT